MKNKHSNTVIQRTQYFAIHKIERSSNKYLHLLKKTRGYSNNSSDRLQTVFLH